MAITESSSELAQSRSEAAPTRLKPVVDVIPERCHQRSTARGLWLFTRDVVLYGLVVWGLLSTNNVLLLIPLWLLSGIVVSSLFVLGHDAAHDSLYDSKRLNALMARVSLLPALHAAEVWIFGHNRVHHGHTLKQGIDFVWHPLTVSDYEDLNRFGRLRHRFEWGPFGAGAYYLREVFWNKMVRFSPPKRWARAMSRDKAIVAVFVIGSLLGLVALYGAGGPWQWVKVVIIPFLLFCQSIGWVVYVQHIAPEIRWWPRREWNRFRGQVEGTTILNGPPGWNLFFHWIMVHVPHHVDMRIPCYRLTEAAKAIKNAFPDHVVEKPIRVRDYLRSVRACKLHDFETGRWFTYASARANSLASSMEPEAAVPS